MKKRPEKIPESVRASISFANPEKIDWEKEKAAVITAVLNKGTWEAVRWIYDYYGEETIRVVVSSPKRGHWFPQALQFWLRFFKLSLEQRLFDQSLIHL